MHQNHKIHLVILLSPKEYLIMTQESLIMILRFIVRNLANKTHLKHKLSIVKHMRYVFSIYIKKGISTIKKYIAHEDKKYINSQVLQLSI